MFLDSDDDFLLCWTLKWWKFLRFQETNGKKYFLQLFKWFLRPFNKIKRRMILYRNLLDKFITLHVIDSLYSIWSGIAYLNACSFGLNEFKWTAESELLSNLSLSKLIYFNFPHNFVRCHYIRLGSTGKPFNYMVHPMICELESAQNWHFNQKIFDKIFIKVDAVIYSRISDMNWFL